MRTRKEVSANYSSVFIDGKTIRIPIDKNKPITELRYPEFYDISPGNLCKSGKCNFCYASASPTGKHYTKLAEKVEKFFGMMTLNERPYQVAIGGEQEPLENPELWEMIQKLKELKIVPNYTTNGVLVTDKVIENTKKYCGGVAVTLHAHLEKFWRKAISKFAENNIKINVHVIISDKESIDYTKKLYEEYANTGIVDYFVLLPYMNYGHAINNPKTIDTDYFIEWLETVYSEGKLAFGANFYNLLKKYKDKFSVSLYPPEIMSKYIALDDKMFLDDGSITIYNNSFDRKPIGFDYKNGCELGNSRTEFLEF